MAFLLSKVVDEHIQYNVVGGEAWKLSYTADMWPVKKTSEMTTLKHIALTNLRRIEIQCAVHTRSQPRKNYSCVAFKSYSDIDTSLFRVAVILLYSLLTFCPSINYRYNGTLIQLSIVIIPQ